MKNPNIIIIIMDAVRPKNLSLYGYEKETDKNLKKIAKESVVFNQAFSCSNFTFPSLISLFSAKYPDNHGMIHQFPYYSEEEFTKFKQNKSWFPSYLKQKGYMTIGIGWPGLWLKKGFDYYKEKESVRRVKEEKDFIKKFIKEILNKNYVKKILLNLPSWAYQLGKRLVKVRASTKFPYAYETTNLAILKILEAKKANKPFFEFIHFQDTHIPFMTTKNPCFSEKKDYKKILRKIKSQSQKEYVKKRFIDIKLFSIQDIKNKYDLAIKNVDEQIGRLMNFLKKEKLWENTVFIILSDHGLSFGENNVYLSSAGLYDTTIRIPLIMRIPGLKIKKNYINNLVQNIDIAPTLLELLKIKNKEKIDGVSLIPLIKTGNPVRNKILSFDGLAEDIKMTGTKNKREIIAKKNLCYLCKSKHHKQGKQEINITSLQK